MKRYSFCEIDSGVKMPISLKQLEQRYESACKNIDDVK